MPGGVSGSRTANSRESVVLKYAIKDTLNLSAGYYNAYDTNPYSLGYPTVPATPAKGRDNNRVYYLGALYKYQKFSVSASWMNGRNPSNEPYYLGLPAAHIPPSPSRVNIDLYSLGFGYQFTPSFKVTSGVYHLEDRNNSANRSTEAAIGAEYFLTRKARVYAQIGHVVNKGTMTTMIAYGDPVAPDRSTTAVDVGVRYAF